MAPASSLETLLGPAAALLKQPGVRQIVLDAPGRATIVTPEGRVQASIALDLDGLWGLAVGLARRAARELDEQQPVVEAMLRDGTRFLAAVPPAFPGPLVSVTLPLRTASLDWRGLDAPVTAALQAGLNLLIVAAPDDPRALLALGELTRVGDRCFWIGPVEASRPARALRLGAGNTDASWRLLAALAPDRVFVDEPGSSDAWWAIEALADRRAPLAIRVAGRTADDGLARLEALARAGAPSARAAAIDGFIAAGLDLILAAPGGEPGLWSVRADRGLPVCARLVTPAAISEQLARLGVSWPAFVKEAPPIPAETGLVGPPVMGPPAGSGGATLEVRLAAAGHDLAVPPESHPDLAARSERLAPPAVVAGEASAAAAAEASAATAAGQDAVEAEQAAAAPEAELPGDPTAGESLRPPAPSEAPISISELTEDPSDPSGVLVPAEGPEPSVADVPLDHGLLPDDEGALVNPSDHGEPEVGSDFEDGSDSIEIEIDLSMVTSAHVVGLSPHDSLGGETAAEVSRPQPPSAPPAAAHSEPSVKVSTSDRAKPVAPPEDPLRALLASLGEDGLDEEEDEDDGEVSTMVSDVVTAAGPETAEALSGRSFSAILRSIRGDDGADDAAFEPVSPRGRRGTTRIHSEED